MIILNQAGDEMFVMENVISIKVAELSYKDEKAWYVNANAIENDIYIVLGRYADESEARSALNYLFLNFRDGMRALQMPSAKGEDGD